MFNSVQLVRDLCKAKNIPIAKLEKDCGFSNGYLNPKKMSKIPYDRAVIIAEYLNVSVHLVLTGKETEKKPLVNDDQELTDYLEMLKTRPECRMLFQLTKNATKEDVEAAVRIIEALRNK